jgi:hypothetical protein
VVRVPGYRSRGPGVIPGAIRFSWEAVGLERGPLSLVSAIEELLGRKSSGSGLESREYSCRDRSRWPRGSLYPQKLALTSLTSGGLSVGVVLSRNQDTSFFIPGIHKIHFGMVAVAPRSSYRCWHYFVYEGFCLMTRFFCHAPFHLSCECRWVFAQSCKIKPITSKWLRDNWESGGGCRMLTWCSRFRHHSAECNLEQFEPHCKYTLVKRFRQRRTVYMTEKRHKANSI